MLTLKEYLSSDSIKRIGRLAKQQRELEAKGYRMETRRNDKGEAENVFVHKETGHVIKRTD